MAGAGPFEGGGGFPPFVAWGLSFPFPLSALGAGVGGCVGPLAALAGWAAAFLLSFFPTTLDHVSLVCEADVVGGGGVLFFPVFTGGEAVEEAIGTVALSAFFPFFPPFCPDGCDPGVALARVAGGAADRKGRNDLPVSSSLRASMRPSIRSTTLSTISLILSSSVAGVDNCDGCGVLTVLFGGGCDWVGMLRAKSKSGS